MAEGMSDGTVLVEMCLRFPGVAYSTLTELCEDKRTFSVSASSKSGIRMSGADPHTVAFIGGKVNFY